MRLLSKCRIPLVRYESRLLAVRTTPELSIVQQQQQRSCSSDTSESPPRRRTALVMGVANHRSIAWACVESFFQRDYNVIFTYQDSSKKTVMENMISSLGEKRSDSNRSVQAIPCNVETDIPKLFQEKIPELLSLRTNENPRLTSIVHSIAYASLSSGTELSEASLEDFQTAHHISTYSLLETAKYAKHAMTCDNASITALSYLGANRAVSNYGLMGPAKASLEACVRGLALELGQYSLDTRGGEPRSIRVNAVSAGPLRTLSSRGIPDFTRLYSSVQEAAPLRRTVTQQEVADTVRFLATEGTGITGQVIYVDGGYSSVVPVL